MRSNHARVNPFYVLLILAGVAFCLTACAYGVMVFLDTRPQPPGGDVSQHPLMVFLARYGTAMLTVELVLLAVATIGAISTDGYWSGRG